MATQQNSPSENEVLVIHFLTIRKSIGVLGIALPFVLITGSILGGGCDGVLSSISVYYHTNTRDIFVGVLCAVSLFLFCYKGYEKKDVRAAKLASIFALGVAFFPSDVSLPAAACLNPPFSTSSVAGDVHLACAGLFFIVLSYFSLVLFKKTSKTKTPTAEKKKRNKVYTVCGWIMLSCIFLLTIYFLLPEKTQQSLNGLMPVFFLETISLLAFGISWLVKGEALLKDKPVDKVKTAVEQKTAVGV